MAGAIILILRPSKIIFLLISIAQHLFSLIPFLMLHLDLAQSSTSQYEQHGCLIQAIDGPAAGCALTHNSDPRNERSYWVHTQPTTPPWGQDKWEIILTEVHSQKCYNIKATTNQHQSATTIQGLVSVDSAAYFIRHRFGQLHE